MFSGKYIPQNYWKSVIIFLLCLVSRVLRNWSSKSRKDTSELCSVSTIEIERMVSKTSIFSILKNLNLKKMYLQTHLPVKMSQAQREQVLSIKLDLFKTFYSQVAQFNPLAQRSLLKCCKFSEYGKDWNRHNIVHSP